MLPCRVVPDDVEIRASCRVNLVTQRTKPIAHNFRVEPPHVETGAEWPRVNRSGGNGYIHLELGKTNRIKPPRGLTHDDDKIGAEYTPRGRHDTAGVPLQAKNSTDPQTPGQKHPQHPEPDGNWKTRSLPARKRGATTQEPGATPSPHSPSPGSPEPWDQDQHRSPARPWEKAPAPVMRSAPAKEREKPLTLERGGPSWLLPPTRAGLKPREKESLSNRTMLRTQKNFPDQDTRRNEQN